ncbi:probable RNA helicase armi [Colias croceus]|uniref:probable RNA helicase armi n=1 Tax=Colias crocea TaxID=72248 RepID=UPI001E27D33E|nr:probable RNA helicase armi [Colias croceus]
MWSYLSPIFNYFFSKADDDEEDNREQFLVDELLDLQCQTEKEEYLENLETVVEIPKNAVCFQKTGIITDCGDNYVLIDGMTYFDVSSCPYTLNVNDKVLYLCYKDTNEKLVVIRILENQGICWDDEDTSEEQKFDIINHVLVGQVQYRQDRLVYIDGGDLVFNLDDVEGTFIPIQGDWLEMQCKVQKNEDKPTDIHMKQVLEVVSFKPVRTKIKSAIVTEWTGSYGTLDRQIYFNNSTLIDGVIPQVGDKVMVEAIESTQGKNAWRSIKMVTIESCNKPTIEPQQSDEIPESLKVEQEKNITMTYPIKFDKVDINETEKFVLNITNNSSNTYILNKWIILSKKRDSQVNIKPFISQPKSLHPSDSIKLTVTCQPKFLGETKECLVFLFKGFQLKRFIEINVVDKLYPLNDDQGLEMSGNCKNTQMLERMRMVRNNNESYIPGVKNCKAPHFVVAKIGNYPIPNKIWSVVLGDSEQTIYSNDYDKIITRIQTHLPCLVQDLNIHNYTDKWHTLLFMEEIQANINVRVYDTPKAFLIRNGEYLALEVTGLCERRPSLIVGDKVIVKDTWDPNQKQYEGFIHMVKGDLVLFKFDNRFHETYDGGDVSVAFHLNRTVYRRAHQAINTVLSNLGPDVLFPSKIVQKPEQVSSEKLQNIQWYNKKLNNGQKNTILNILKGESRPLPYVIFGPPGTGKTVTVVETILQILTNIPESRILVATPSNSASNLITERLIQYRHVFSSSIVRLIASYLVDSENIPDEIKPYCATLDIAREGTSMSKHMVKDGMNLNCQKSFIGRHRVTIATCNCVGSLYYMGFPKGHFSHIIIDEAGQANEPEIMIPMSFTDKENGQIVLAGDPMQLGPVVMSKYCKEFGMDVSYLCRLLETYPYQKDFDSYKDGFDARLVTRLSENYRSLEEVLSLPSKMFYDDSLVTKFDKDAPWIPRIIDATSDIFNITEDKTGGIFVYGIKGQNARAEDSPSWYNPQEASMVALTTCKLYKNNVTPEEIGIITPYIAQIKYLRLVFDAMGLPQPKIGTVEEFQGQERPIILISTVRSAESLIKDDVKHVLGFIQNPKRVNVAITRAQISLILFCNPILLCTDPLWNAVITHAVKNNKYMGCYLPFQL